MYEKTTLPNGLRILSSIMPHTRSVTATIFVGTGSRYERDEEAGISHFIEHLFFKGTDRRPSAQHISEAIEGVGGVINAFTDREMTGYWCKVARLHFGLALDVLTDALLYSKFEPHEIERERDVIIEELSMIHDDPREWVDVVIDEVLWPNQPLGRDVAGSKETVSRFSRELALGYLGNHYSPRNTVVSVAGNVSHEEVVDAVGKLLGDWRPVDPGSWFPASVEQTAPRLRVDKKDTEQAHLCLAVHGLSLFDEDRYILDLLNAVLGEGMSSRLFQEIREKRGLAYDVHSYISHFLDAGSAVVYAGVHPDRIADTIAAVLEELNRLKTRVPEAELVKAKEFKKGRMLLGMEDTRSVASWIGGQELLLDRVRTVDEIVALLDAVNADDLHRIATEIFVTDKLNVAIVGPFAGNGRFESLLRF